MKKSFLLLIIGCLLSITLFAQQVPNEITFHFVQFKVTMGSNSSSNPPSTTCTTFIKSNNKIIATECNSEKSDVDFIITGIQQEKTVQGVYSLTFNGYRPDPLSGKVPGFATYTYDSSTRLWSLLMEDMWDNASAGLARTLLYFFNVN